MTWQISSPLVLSPKTPIVVTFVFCFASSDLAKLRQFSDLEETSDASKDTRRLKLSRKKASFMGTGSGSDPESSSSGWSRAPGLVVKTLFLIGGAVLLKRLTKSTTRWDHSHVVSRSISGEKFSKEQASRDPDNYFNIRMVSCPAAEMVDGSQVLYLEQAFWRTPQKPFRQRLYMVKPCPKELKCDVEVSSYAIRDAEEYKNFCDRPKDQRPLPEEVIGDIGEHLTTIQLSCCDRGKRCLYEGSAPPGGFPNSWNGASYCTSDLTVLKNNEIHLWDRGFDDDGNQVWGPKQGPYEFKPAPSLSSINNDVFSPLNIFPQSTLDKPIKGSFILQE